MPGYTSGASFSSGKSHSEVRELRAGERKKHSDNARSRSALNSGRASKINRADNPAGKRGRLRKKSG